MRHSCLDELAYDNEVRIHQEAVVYIRQLCGEGALSYPGRSVWCLKEGTEGAVRPPDRHTEVSRRHSTCASGTGKARTEGKMSKPIILCLIVQNTSLAGLYAKR